MRTPFTESGSENQNPAPLFAALVLVALVPAVGVLWFMSVAMRNERLAVQAQLTEIHANHLVSLQQHVTAFANERQAALQAHTGASPSEIFASVVNTNLADSVIVYDSAAKALYPAVSITEAPAGGINDAARALQLQAAELLNAGQKDQALAKLAELTNDARLRNAVGAQGTLIVPNAQLLLLKTLGSPEVGPALRAGLSSSAIRNANSGRLGEPSLPRQILTDLVARLNDYTPSDLPPAQRRFLMTEIRALAPTPNLFPTLAAEELAADYLEQDPAPPVVAGVADPGPASTDRRGSPQARPATFLRTPLPKVWRLPGPGGTVVALFREDRLRAELESFLAPFVLPGAQVMVLPPSAALAARPPFLSKDAGNSLPGWRLALGFRGDDPLAAASARQTRFYLWVGVGVVAIIGSLAFMVARYVAAQVRLARLKNELVSTVSHELKTPLASMRALVDTLLARRYRDEGQLQDYLRLVAKENLRLSQLIENFLAFSRMERGQQRFQFEDVPPQEVVRLAIDALGDRLSAPQCTLTNRLAPQLPPIRGDADALATVLINLLDNACKYSNGTKRIEVRTHVEGTHVVFEVEDNGIGIARDEQRRIFDRFYQVDQSLTRQRGGCGLGLSIVDYIVKAHGGTVEIESEPGRGTTFRVKIPVAPGATLNAQRLTLNAQIEAEIRRTES